MDSAGELLIKVEQLRTFLINRATGKSQPTDDDTYAKLRQELIAVPQLNLPSVVFSCEHLRALRNSMPELPTYDKRKEYLWLQFEPVLNMLRDRATLSSDSSGAEMLSNVGDPFRHQFPAGLPFGLSKPSLAFIPERGSQTARFEDGSDIGVIREKVYPDFTFELLQDNLKGSRFVLSIPALLHMCQTEREKSFLSSYSSTYNMRSAKVPVLIPQAWIQWHSRTKANLRSEASSYVDDLYRVDFVAFWKRRRFAILVDGIDHYAIKVETRWEANEEAYSKRLKEDRKLRKEGWQVFRVSNWEIRQESSISEILTDLREYIGF